ncbi:MAG: MerR family transcriptional regulator, partial [Tissierellaceae bacterium]
MIDLSYEYSISEVAEITGFAPHVLRYYEKEFDIDVPRRDSNHRYYTYREIELIQYIKDLKDKGFGNKQIKMIINSPETVFNQEETNLALVKDDVSMVDSREIASQISTIIEDRFFEKLSNYLEENHNNTSDLVEALKEEIIALRKEINSKEHDVLI